MNEDLVPFQQTSTAPIGSQPQLDPQTWEGFLAGIARGITGSLRNPSNSGPIITETPSGGWGGIAPVPGAQQQSRPRTSDPLVVLALIVGIVLLVGLD